MSLPSYIKKYIGKHREGRISRWQENSGILQNDAPQVNSEDITVINKCTFLKPLICSNISWERSTVITVTTLHLDLMVDLINRLPQAEPVRRARGVRNRAGEKKNKKPGLSKHQDFAAFSSLSHSSLYVNCYFSLSLSKIPGHRRIWLSVNNIFIYLHKK